MESHFLGSRYQIDEDGKAQKCSSHTEKIEDLQNTVFDMINAQFWVYFSELSWNFFWGIKRSAHSAWASADTWKICPAKQGGRSLRTDSTVLQRRKGKDSVNSAKYCYRTCSLFPSLPPPQKSKVCAQDRWAVNRCFDKICFFEVGDIYTLWFKTKFLNMEWTFTTRFVGLHTFASTIQDPSF